MAIVLSIQPKRRIDQNDLARAVAARETGRKQVDIAQIKEVLRIALDLLGQEWRDNPRGVAALLRDRTTWTPGKS